MNKGSSDRLDALSAGTTLRRYVLESVLGHGGFGIVYRARHCELDTVVAIKEYMPTELSVRRQDSVEPRSASCSQLYEDGLRRFLDEARQLVRFRNHPCVVSCQDLFRDNNTAYLVMESVDGLPLSELLRLRETAGQPFVEEELLGVMVPLLEGLATVHAEGVLHRDVKPSNILIRRSNEQPVLIDFGAAKQVVAERSRSIAPYTDGYAAIEQVGAGELGPWTDVYGLGAVMWRVVAGGNPPWEAPNWKDRNWCPPNPLKVETRVQAQAFDRPDPLPTAREIGASRYSMHVLDAIDRCLRLAEGDRVKDCEELLDLIRAKPQQTALSASEPLQLTHTTGNRPDGARPSAGLRRFTGALAVLVPVLLAVIVAALFLGGFAALLEFGNAGEPIPKSFTVETVPANAQVRFMEIDQIYNPGMELPPGPYLVEVAADGFETKHVQVEHDTSSSAHLIDLEPVVAGFRVVTVPPRAEVRLVGRREAYRPGMQLRYGSYEVEVSAPGYMTRLERVEHDGRDPPRIELMRVSTSFRVDTTPPGAKVRLVGRNEAYRAGMQLRNGSYEVEVSAPGYTTRRVQVEHDGRNIPRIELVPVLASFQVDTVPPGAMVRILNGPSPYSAGMRLPPAAYFVEVSAPGHRKKMATIHHGSSPTRERVELEPIVVLRAGGGITSPELIKKVEPQYTDEAKQAELEGTVFLVAEVWEDGILHNIHVVKSLGMGLDEKAIEAVEEWEFAPGTLNGKPVKVRVQIEVSFRLL